MPAIHFRKTVDASPEDVYAALATRDGLAGNWTDQLDVPEEPGGVARFGFGPDRARTLELRIDALEPGRRVEWTPVGGFPGRVGTSITWELEPAEEGGTAVHFTHGGWPDQAADGEMAMYFTAGAPVRADSAGTWHRAAFPRGDTLVAPTRSAPRCGYTRARHATLGTTSWATSLFADQKMASYLLPLNAETRRREQITAGDTVTITLALLT